MNKSLRRLFFGFVPQNSEENRDQKLSITFVWYVIMIYLTNVFEIMGDMFGETAAGYLGYITWFNKGLLLFLLLLNLFDMLIRCRKSLILLVFVLMITIIISAIIVPEDSRFYEQVRDFIIICLPPMLVVSNMAHYHTLFRGLSRMSVPILLSSGILLLVSFRFSFPDYYMGFSNAMTIPICIAVYDFFGYGKITRLLLAGMGLTSVLVLGSRGALLSISAYIVTCYLFTNKIRKDGTRRKSFEPKKLMVVIPAVLLVIYSRTIIQVAYDFLYARGILSRTLWTFLNHYGSSTRSGIYSEYLTGIREHPFTIRGIGGDSVLSGAYAHNFIIEALAEFGVIIGGIFLLIIIVYVFKLYTTARKKEYYEMGNMLFCASLPIMVVSGTFWNTPFFWSWFAVMVKHTKVKTQQRIYKEKQIGKIA